MKLALGTQAFIPETVLMENGSSAGSRLPSENPGLLPLPLQRCLSLNRLESKSEVCMITQWPEELPASNLGGLHSRNDGYSY